MLKTIVVNMRWKSSPHQQLESNQNLPSLEEWLLGKPDTCQRWSLRLCSQLQIHKCIHCTGMLVNVNNIGQHVCECTHYKTVPGKCKHYKTVPGKR